MDFEFIREQTPLYIEAAKLTLHMAVIGVLLAIVVGLVCSMIKYFRIPVLRQIVECYIELSRNTPLLIQLFFLYFGLPKIGIVLSSEQCAITGLTFLGGSYMAEAFRSGLDNVPPIQVVRGTYIRRVIGECTDIISHCSRNIRKDISGQLHTIA